MSRSTCAACRRRIDATARLCPYCGVDPLTGRQAGSQTIIPEARPPEGGAKTGIALARQRQGIAIAVTALAAIVVLAAFHHFVIVRNATEVTDTPAVPLTEITDLSAKFDESAPVPMPHLDFPYEGRPRAMRTYVVESGAIKPTDAQPAPAPAAPPR
jgi:hypothetical protein